MMLSQRDHLMLKAIWIGKNANKQTLRQGIKAKARKKRKKEKKRLFLSSPRYPKQQKVVYCCMFCKMLSAQFFSFMYGV